VQQGLVAEYRDSHIDNDILTPDEKSERGGHVLVLEPVGMHGSIVFVLCAALETFWHNDDGVEIRKGQLLQLPHNCLSLLAISEPPQPEPTNRHGKRLIV